MNPTSEAINYQFITMKLKDLKVLERNAQK